MITMRICFISLILLTAVVSAGAQEAPRQPAAPTAVTGSLYNPAVGQVYSRLFSDNKAQGVGDLVTILVLESTQSNIGASSQSARKSEASFGIENAGGIGGRLVLPHLPGAVPGRIISGNGNYKFSGDGTTERSSEFSTTISGRVIEVLPNGDLVVEASKVVEVNREKQTMVLYGIIRPQDIDRNNIVSSSDIAELKVRLEGKGFITDANKPGWLFRFLQRISPF